MSETRQMPYHTDPEAGYELFRCAILQDAPEKWEMIYQLYAPLVYSWVRHHPGFINTGEEACYFVNCAFEKLWHALTPAKFANFTELKAVLGYLQLCVHSVIIDHLRMAKQRQCERAFPPEEQHPCPSNIEEKVQDEAWRQEFWAYVNTRLKNERERKLLYYRFVCDIKPRELCVQFPQVFPDIHEVYTLTQKILARLSRNAELAGYLGEL